MRYCEDTGFVDDDDDDDDYQLLIIEPFVELKLKNLPKATLENKYVIMLDLIEDCDIIVIIISFYTIMRLRCHLKHEVLPKTILELIYMRQRPIVRLFWNLNMRSCLTPNIQQ